MTAQRDKLLAEFIAGPERVRAALGDLVGRALDQPGDGGWTIREVLVHLADAEILRATRLRLILGGEDVVLPIFDENEWHDRLGYGERDPRVALATYEATVVASHELLLVEGASGWMRSGLHPEDGPLSVRELVARGVTHADDHVRQIAHIAATL